MGGIGVGVDLATGRTTTAWGSGGRLSHHPDLGVALEGAELPMFDQILEIAALCHDALGLGYFGADIVLDRDFGPMVLEINGRPGLGIQLANHRGLRPLLEAVERSPASELGAHDRTHLGREIFAASL